MTVDWEQIRQRKPESIVVSDPTLGQGYGEFVLITADERDALLTELEQAEEEADQLDSRLDAANLRLAKVPALVEALRGIADPVGKPFASRDETIARAALAAWEQE